MKKIHIVFSIFFSIILFGFSENVLDKKNIILYKEQKEKKTINLLYNKSFSKSKILNNKWGKLSIFPPKLLAKSWILMDAKTGQVLIQNNANITFSEKNLPKFMLLYIIENELLQGNIQISDIIKVSSPISWTNEGSRMFILSNVKISVQDLIKEILQNSGNDSSLELAKYISGTTEEYINIMNHVVHNLKMQNTYFFKEKLFNLHNYSSAYDMALLAKALINKIDNNPNHFSKLLTNIYPNKLLFLYFSLCIFKNDPIKLFQYSLVSIEKMKNNPMKLICVVIGNSSIDKNITETKALLNYGFQFFKEKCIYKKNVLIKYVPISLGNQSHIPIGVPYNLILNLPKNYKKTSLKANLIIKKKLYAPISKGAKIGDIEILLNNKIIATIPAISLLSISRIGIWHKIF